MENNMGKILKLMTVFSILATCGFRCMQTNTLFDAVRVSGRMGIRSFIADCGKYAWRYTRNSFSSFKSSS